MSITRAMTRPIHKACLLDLSGTIHVEDESIGQAIKTVQTLKTYFNGNLKYVTNTTKESGQTLFNRLKKIGFQLEKDEIFTSLTAARKLVEQLNCRPMCMLSGDAMLDFQGIDQSNPNAVLIGLAPDQFHYERMTEAMRLLLDGAELIAIHKARYFKRSDGLALGPGAIVTGLEYSSGKTARVVGKPTREFFQSAVHSLNSELKVNECIMIGDDWRDDVQGALDCGMTGILVRTGKYRAGDEDKIQCKDPARLYVIDSVDDMIQLIDDGKL